MRAFLKRFFSIISFRLMDRLVYVTPETLRSTPIFYGDGLVPSGRDASNEPMQLEGEIFTDHWQHADVMPVTSNAFESSVAKGSFVMQYNLSMPPAAPEVVALERCYGLMDHLFAPPGVVFHEVTKEMAYMLLQRISRHGMIVLGNHASMSCACVLISCKYCQNKKPLVNDMLSRMGCNVPGRREYVLRYEVEILQALGWSLQAPTITGLCFLAGLLHGISAARSARFAASVRACYRDLSDPPSSLQGIMEQDKRIAALACYRSSGCNDDAVFAADASAMGLGLMDEDCARYAHCVAHIGRRSL